MFQPLHPETGAPLHVTCVIAAADFLCILSSANEMSLLNVVTCETSCCMLMSQSFQEEFNVAWKLENTVTPVIVLSFTEDVDHEALIGVCDQGPILDQSCRQQDCVPVFGAGHRCTVTREACVCSATGIECAL